MRDASLSLILSLIQHPEKTLKFYLDASKVTRGTFFKVKAELEQMGILHWNDSRRIAINQEKSLHYLESSYPGLLTLVGSKGNVTGPEHQAADKED